MLLVEQVGILDVDLCGPSIPKMFDIAECDIRRNAQGYVQACFAAMSDYYMVSIVWTRRRVSTKSEHRWVSIKSGHIG